MIFTGAIKIQQSRETDNTGHTRRRKTKRKHNTICVRHNYVQANKKIANKTCILKNAQIIDKTPDCRVNLNIQYKYIVGKYIIYLYDLYRKKSKLV
jgi:hypothetical protein